MCGGTVFEMWVNVCVMSIFGFCFVDWVGRCCLFALVVILRQRALSESWGPLNCQFSFSSFQFIFKIIGFNRPSQPLCFFFSFGILGRTISSCPNYLHADVSDGEALSRHQQEVTGGQLVTNSSRVPWKREKPKKPEGETPAPERSRAQGSPWRIITYYTWFWSLSKTFFLSFFLGANIQLHHWTKRMVSTRSIFLSFFFNMTLQIWENFLGLFVCKPP